MDFIPIYSALNYIFFWKYLKKYLCYANMWITKWDFDTKKNLIFSTFAIFMFIKRAVVSSAYRDQGWTDTLHRNRPELNSIVSPSIHRFIYGYCLCVLSSRLRLNDWKWNSHSRLTKTKKYPKIGRKFGTFQSMVSVNYAISLSPSFTNSHTIHSS